MTVLITGGAGYIGSHVALCFLDAGRPVVAVDNLSNGHKSLVPDKATFVEMDIRNTAKLSEVMVNYRVETVVHCAASTVVPDSVSRPLEYYDNNVLGTLSLLHAMKAGEVKRLVFSSTAAVYATGDGAPLTEQSPISPASPYGMTKFVSERIIIDVAASDDLKFVILRYFNVAGADRQQRSGQSTPNATHLIKLALEAACGKRPTMTVFGTDWPTADGTGVRDFIHVSDLAQLHLFADNYLVDGGKNDIFNCGYGHGYSVQTVLDHVEALSETKLDIQIAPRRPGDLAQVIANSQKIQTRFNWKPQHDNLDSMISSALAWEKKGNA